VTNALTGLTRTTNTSRFETEEILTTSYKVDFTRENPLISQDNRVAVRYEEDQMVIDSGLSYRLDVVALLTVEENGLISNVNFYYDSYVPSQAFADQPDLITNPDIDPVLNPKRDLTANSEDTLNAVLNFFGTFASITDGDFTKLLPVIQPDTVISFAGDPKFLPFADNEIRVGSDAVIETFNQQLTDSSPRTFDLQEFFVKNDLVIANTFEQRTAVATQKGYDVQVQIQLTAKKEGDETVSKVNSIQGNYDSVFTTTAFTANDPFPINNAPKPAARTQGDAEFINLTGYDGNVTVNLDVFSEAAYNNSIGIYKVDDITGRIGTLKPGDTGYLEQAINNTVLNFDRGTPIGTDAGRTQATVSTSLASGSILTAYIITNGNAQDLLATNPSNVENTQALNAYFTSIGANPDNFDHFRLANDQFQVEDWWGGGDRDFNDMQFKVTVT
jgi:ketosteroid isomerase-like protein